MIIKTGQKGVLLNINHTKGEELMTAAVKMSVHGGRESVNPKEMKEKNGKP